MRIHVTTHGVKKQSIASVPRSHPMCPFSLAYCSHLMYLGYKILVTAISVQLRVRKAAAEDEEEQRLGDSGDTLTFPLNLEHPT